MLKNNIRYPSLLLILILISATANAQNPPQPVYEYCGPQYGYPCPAGPRPPPNAAYRPQVNPPPPRFLHSLDLTVSSDAGGIDYRRETPLYDIVAGFLHNDDDDRDAYYAGVLAGGYFQQILPAPTRIGIGVLGVGIDADDVGDGGAVALSSTIRFPLNIGFPGLALEGKVSYGPSFSSFGDVEEYFEIDGRLVYNALPNASIFIGLRNVEAEIEQDDGSTVDVKIDDSLYGGIRLRFW
jgi:hypothetical protein